MHQPWLSYLTISLNCLNTSWTCLTFTICGRDVHGEDTGKHFSAVVRCTDSNISDHEDSAFYLLGSHTQGELPLPCT